MIAIARYLQRNKLEFALSGKGMCGGRIMIFALFVSCAFFPIVARADSPIFTLSKQVFSRGYSDLALGDLDGDGDLDAMLGYFLRPTEVWLNDGQGHFDTPGQTLETPPLVGDDALNAEIALGDLDGDGDLDAVLDYFARRTKVWLNDGQGHFDTLGQTLGTRTSMSTELGDLDGDGDLDAVLSYRYGLTEVWLNDGQGHFDTPGQTLGVRVAERIALGDLDGDGDLDAVLGYFLGPTEVWLNDGQGHFDTPGQTLEAPNAEKIALGDLDGDGDLDAVLGYRDRPMEVWLNDGQGHFKISWQPLGTPPIGDDALSAEIALGDLDGDGDLDAVLGHAPGLTEVWLNDGQGHFDTPGQTLETSDTLRIVLGDLDGDGDLDMAIASLFSVSILVNNRNPFFLEHVFPSAVDIALGDLDGDSDLDAVLGHAPEPTDVWLNDGQGHFEMNGQTLGTPVGDDGLGDLDGAGFLDFLALGGRSEIALGDLDGDGDLDAVLSNVVYLNDGRGHFDTSGQILPVSPTLLGDLDGDGDLDAVGGNVAYLNDGQGHFDTHGQFLTASPTLLGDLNGDGDLDAMMENSSEALLEVWLNNGQGPFDTPGQILPTYAARGITLGDLDSDGNLDAVLGYLIGPTEVWLNNGQGHFDVSGPLGNSLTTFVNEIALGDLDGDGDLDAVLGHYNGPTEVWLNDGQGHFDTSGQILPTPAAGRIALGDLDGNGKHDVVVLGSDENYLLLNPDRGQNRFQVNLQKPSSTPSTHSSSTSVIIEDQHIPFTYTLFHPQGQPVGRVEGWYSLDGGGKWQRAVATTDTITSTLATNPFPLVTVTNTHVYTWNTFDSGFFGQSENVVFRLKVYPQPVPAAPGTYRYRNSVPGGFPTSVVTTTYRYINSVPGGFFWPYASATTFPFRVRGTQVRVVDADCTDTLCKGIPDAVVYRLDKEKQTQAIPIAPGSNREPFHTNLQGYLQGRGTLGLGDELIALQPITTSSLITFTDSISLYYTSISPTIAADNLTVTRPITQAGVQTLTISEKNKLLLFNIDVSLEWDARNDPAYLRQLQQDLERASEILYDLTNGQAAFGDVRVYQNKNHWGDADIQIYASNSVRPNATLGGIVSMPFTETVTITNENGNKEDIPVVYRPGQIRIGATWNRFGQNTGEIGEDWPRVLAHEFGHYAFFLWDHYLGVDETKDVLIRGHCPGSIMENSYFDSYSEFHSEQGWDDDCEGTLAEWVVDRSDWETIEKFYPMTEPKANDNQSSFAGPNRLPLAVTKVQPVNEGLENSPQTLPAPFFSIDTDDKDNFSEQKGYLFKLGTSAVYTDDYIIELGTSNPDFILARGAGSGDHLCVFDKGNQPLRVGCTSVGTVASSFEVTPTHDWNPQVEVTPVTMTVQLITGTTPITSATLVTESKIVTGAVVNTVLAITVTNPVSINQQLCLQIYPTYAGAEPPQPMERLADGKRFTSIITVTYPVFNGITRVWASDSEECHELFPKSNKQFLTKFNLGTGWIGDRVAWHGDTLKIDGYRPAFGGGGDRVAWHGDWGSGVGGDRVAWHGNHAAWSADLMGYAPVSSPNGQIIFLNLERHALLSGDKGTYILQEIGTPPTLPSWLTPVGSAYHLRVSGSSEQAAVTDRWAVTFNYLQRQVPEGQESGLTIYYLADGDLRNSWQPLETAAIDTDFNVASAKARGVGIYVLVAAAKMSYLYRGWNNFGYPIAGTQPVTTALASIAGKYAAIYQYEAGPVPQWRVYDPSVATDHPELAALVNDLHKLEFGQAYWLSATEGSTLYLDVTVESSQMPTNSLASPGLQAVSGPTPPATFYGWISPTLSVTPTIIAKVDGEACGQPATVSEIQPGKFAYKVQVPASCGGLDKRVRFEINGKVVGDEQPWNNSRALYHPLINKP